MDPRAHEIIERQGLLKGERGVWESHWQQIADRVLPRAASFTSTLVPGRKHTELIFDATACLALDRYASAVESLICPRNEKWHALEPADEDLAENDGVKRWLELLANLLFRVRYETRANFSAQAHEALIQLGAFGTAGMFVDDGLNYEGVAAQATPIVYRSMPLSKLFIAENARGQVDTIHRVFTLKARQAIQKFGDDCPQRIRDAATGDASRDWLFIHCVAPSDDPSKHAGAWDHTAMPFWSTYVSQDLGEVVREGGYRSMPGLVSRNVTAPEEVYGRSPAMIVLPDIKMLNEMSKTTIRAAHKVVSPPLLLADDGLGAPFDLRPDALNFGHVDAQGHQLVHPLQTGANVPLGEEMMAPRRQAINDAFLITLFQILAQDREMTAYEAALRAQEKGQLLAPTMGRQEAEFLGPMIERELDILWSRGIVQRALPPMPPALADRGGAIRVRYTSPMARLRMAEQAAGIQTFFQQIGPLVQVAPSALDLIDTDATAMIIADANGFPQKGRRTPEDLKAVRAAKQQQVDQQQILAAAPVAAQAAKDITAAGVNAASAPSPAVLPVPPGVR